MTCLFGEDLGLFSLIEPSFSGVQHILTIGVT